MAELLPRTLDRFREAEHLLALIMSMEAVPDNEPLASWYAGAHLTASIGMDEAAEYYYMTLGEKLYRGPALAKEFWLAPDAPTWEEHDPVGVARAYREMRIGRTHYGRSVVFVDSPVLDMDLVRGDKSPPQGRGRWFLVPSRSCHRCPTEAHVRLREISAVCSMIIAGTDSLSP